MIQWKKYDANNPPEFFKQYLVSDGRYVDVAMICNYFDEVCWYASERSQVDEYSITHYAEINLPQD